MALDKFKTPKSLLISILLSNGLVLVGWLWMGWDIGDVLGLYVLESVVAGIFNLFKISRAEGVAKPLSGDARKKKVQVNVNISMNLGSGKVKDWSTFHYLVLFLMTYGVFLIVLASMLFSFVDVNLVGVGVILWLMVVVMGQWLDYKNMFMDGGEYKLVTPMHQAMKPMVRLVIIGVPLVAWMIWGDLGSGVLLGGYILTKAFLDVLYVYKRNTSLVYRYGDQVEEVTFE